jgi:hypothetical protein
VAPPPRPTAGPGVQPPPPPPPLAAWRAKLAEVEHLGQVRHPAFDVAGGYDAITAVLAKATDELAALVAALPDDALDLPEAACRLTPHTNDRGVLEAQLRRGIAAVHRRATDLTQRYGSLRAQYLSVQVSWLDRGDKLEAMDSDLLMGGAAYYACTTPDEGHLRVLLADVYAMERHYPKDPFTGKAYAGRPTTKRKVPRAAIEELDAMYREISAAAPDDVALATLVDLASVAFCDVPGANSPLCLPRLKASARALAIRAHALPAGDPVLADARVAHARLVARASHKSARADAEQELRKVLAEATPGTEARLHAALDLNGMLRARHDLAGARALEPGLRDDLARPAGTHTYEWSTIAEAWAAAAHFDGRDADAAAIIAAAIRGVTPPNPECHDDDACDTRGFQVGLLGKQAAYDPGAAPALRAQAAQLTRDLTQLRARHSDEVRRMLATRP